MKKTSKLILTLLAAICVLSGCAGSNTGGEEETVIMRATVTSFEKASFLVTPEDGSEELKSSDSFYISSQYLPEDTELKVGDQVEITYSGYIKETYPASLEKITEVKILESGTEEQSAENIRGDYPACVMIDGIIYKDTGYCNSMIGCGTMDGVINSSVNHGLPTENDQSNFGKGYEYQRSTEDSVVVVIDDEWRIFRDIESEDTSIPEQVKNFNADVNEIRDDGTMLVSYISMPDGFTPMSEGDYVVSTENIRGEVNEGDTVTIWFDGSVEETEPAQIGFAYRIEKVTE